MLGILSYIKRTKMSVVKLAEVSASRINPDVMSPVSPVPANIYKVSEDITVNEGSNVTLSCLASGRPDPAITWRLLNPSGKNHPISAHCRHVSQDKFVL